ncbi:MAG: hypothetical protein HYR67_00875 [Bacteroidetes bacterium]|nr:hypothetical protein [Bacteroidota bacterium]
MFWLLRYQASRELQQRLDAFDYAESQTVTIKIPLTLPYQLNSDGFERVSGEFEYHGEFYKLVKQKLENDTLKIVCIKDHKEKQLVSTMIDFTKLSNDLPATSTMLKLFGNFIKEYNSVYRSEIRCTDGWNADIFFGDPSFTIFSTIIPVHSPPPKSFS